MYVPKSEKKVICYRSYKHFNESAFLDELLQTPFHVATVFDDLDDQYWFHNKLWEGVVNSNAPTKKRAIPPTQLPFMNGQLRKAINVKGMLKRKYLKFKTMYNKTKFQDQSNLVIKLKKQFMK